MACGWFSLSRWQRLAVNFGWLLGGQGAASILGLLSTAICARTLGADEFGVVVMLQAGALLVRQFCNFKTADATVRFGVALHASSDSEGWRSMLRGLFRLDVIGMLMAVGVTALIVGAGMSLRPELFPSTSWIYVLAATGFIEGTAKGTLRVLDRYRILGALEATGSVVRLTGAAIAAWLEAPFEAFIVVYGVALWLDHGLLTIPAWLAVRSDLRSQPPNKSVPLHKFDGVVSFLRSVYWQSNIDALMRQGPTLLVGTVLSSGDAGIYRLARDVAEVIRKPVALIRQAIFPDLARTWLNEPAQFLRFTVQVAAVLAAVGVLFMAMIWYFGDQILNLLGGAEFVAGTPLVILLVAVAVLELPSASLRPAVYTLSGERLVLGLSLLTASTYAVTFLWLDSPIGLYAAGWSSLVAYGVAFAGYLVLLRILLRRSSHRALPPAS
ncbi:MAG: lipopolysaccharide biosynthesis protein [Gammaproteobacteria bacterium]|nr:lipopolysaccharide biosynthesis protein [Gammaproteobacteria bacterium]